MVDFESSLFMKVLAWLLSFSHFELRNSYKKIRVFNLKFKLQFWLEGGPYFDLSIKVCGTYLNPDPNPHYKSQFDYMFFQKNPY